MPSSVIRRFAYNAAKRELWIEFVTGRRYIYGEVPADVAEAFALALSKGIFFNRRIRDAFKCREVTGAETES
jgi:hypothetical protein